MKFDAATVEIVTFLRPSTLGCVIALMAASGNYAVAEISLSPGSGGCQLVQTSLKADGKLKVSSDSTDQRPIRILGELRYFDVQAGQSDGRQASARHYQTAKATISVAGRVNESQLEDGRRLMFVRQESDRVVFYSPAGPLTRGDLDLVSVQFDPQVILQMLDGKTANLNRSWKPSSSEIAQLLSLDGVIESTVNCKLLSATPSIAEVRIEGEAEGTALGATSKVKVEGTIKFDRARKSVSRVEMTIHEDRDVGLFAPGFEIEAHIDTTISPAKQPTELNDKTLAHASRQPSAPQLAIDFGSPTMGLAFIHHRDWRVTLHRRDLLVLRMVRDGKFVAQCNITPGLAVGDDRDADAVKFQSHVEEALAKNAGRIEEISTATNDADVEIVRIAAKGMAKEVPINWIYYMLTTPSGERAAVVFTLAQDQQEEFGKADHELIGAVRFINGQRSTRVNESGTQR